MNKGLFEPCLFCHPDEGLILKKSLHFTVIHDPFALCEGHLMVISDQHFGCIGELPKELFDELDLLVLQIEFLLTKHFGSCIFFEHGRSGTCHQSDEWSCDHMHLHLLPLELNLHEILSNQFSPLPVTQLSDVRRYYHSLGEYLLFCNHDRRNCFYSSGQTPVPPHYFRTLISQALENPENAKWGNRPYQFINIASLMDPV